MSCPSCGPSRFSPEYTRRFKPENNNGCCGCGGCRHDCSKPSPAREGSALWEWEQKYGRLITSIAYEHDQAGRLVQKVTKTICPATTKAKRSDGCCAMRYRVIR